MGERGGFARSLRTQAARGMHHFVFHPACNLVSWPQPNCKGSWEIHSERPHALLRIRNFFTVEEGETRRHAGAYLRNSAVVHLSLCQPAVVGGSVFLCSSPLPWAHIYASFVKKELNIALARRLS